jgi:hypothetical protein
MKKQRYRSKRKREEKITRSRDGKENRTKIKQEIQTQKKNI